MSAETIHHPFDFDAAQTREWKAAHIDSFGEALDSEEFERFLQLPRDAVNNVLAKAYIGHLTKRVKRGGKTIVLSERTDSTDRVLAAYLDFLQSDKTFEQAADEFDVIPLDIQSLASNMPDYLAKTTPAVLWNGRPMGSAALQRVVHVEDIYSNPVSPAASPTEKPVAATEERFDIEQEPEEEEPVKNEVAKVVVPLPVQVQQVRVVEQILPKGPELPPYDPKFPFLGEEAMLGDWMEQGQAMMAELTVKGVVNGDALWKHLGRNEERSKSMNNVFHSVAARFKRNEDATRHMRVGTKSFNSLAAALLQKPAKQSTSHLEALELAMVRSVPGAVRDTERARCVAFGIIAELYADELPRTEQSA